MKTIPSDFRLASKQLLNFRVLITPSIIQVFLLFQNMINSQFITIKEGEN